MSRLVDAGAWVGGGLRREVFFFPSEGVRLYGSLYASAAPTRPLGVVVCGSWGVEAERSGRLAHGLALSAARQGGAGLVFHYPGFGDSYGDAAGVTMEGLAAAAADARAEAERRSGASDWFLAGFTFGAAVACMAQSLTRARGLLLLQPALSPSAYLADLGKRARRSFSETSGAGMAFGYPLPERLVSSSRAADAAVERALSLFRGDGVAIRYEAPTAQEPIALPESIERLAIPGTLRFGAMDQPHMARTAARWLGRRPVGSVAATR
jgi:hypothetical protein